MPGQTLAQRFGGGDNGSFADPFASFPACFFWLLFRPMLWYNWDFGDVSGKGQR